MVMLNFLESTDVSLRKMILERTDQPRGFFALAVFALLGTIFKFSIKESTASRHKFGL